MTDRNRTRYEIDPAIVRAIVALAGGRELAPADAEAA